MKHFFFSIINENKSPGSLASSVPFFVVVVKKIKLLNVTFKLEKDNWL